MDAAVTVAPPPLLRPFEVVGDSPGPRCGHTLTAIYADETEPDTAKLILFGGATALKSNDKADTAAGAKGGFLLDGATNEVHVFDVYSGTWKKITPLGEAPSPRAGHAAAAVGQMIVFQGGVGPDGLSSEDLHVLNFIDFDNPTWHRVSMDGEGPGRRYSHVMGLVANRFLVVTGGNDGRNTLGDAWALDTAEKPYKWRKIYKSVDMPPARMYASCASRQDGLFLLCGGRDAKGEPLGDMCCFARDHDGRWELATAPGPMRVPRYQAAAVVVNDRLHITGGAVRSRKLVEEELSVVTLDTAKGVWSLSENSMPRPDNQIRRCRHAAASVGGAVFIYGGLFGGRLLSDFLIGFDGPNDEMRIGDTAAAPWQSWKQSGGALNQMVQADVEEAATVQQDTAQSPLDADKDQEYKRLEQLLLEKEQELEQEKERSKKMIEEERQKAAQEIARYKNMQEEFQLFSTGRSPSPRPRPALLLDGQEVMETKQGLPWTQETFGRHYKKAAYADTAALFRPT